MKEIRTLELPLGSRWILELVWISSLGQYRPIVYREDDRTAPVWLIYARHSLYGTLMGERGLRS